VPPGVTLPTLRDVVEIRTRGRITIVTTKAYSPATEAMYTKAGATISEVQRMTLEEIFVANVMNNRREQAA
jgi:ABC-2 type transport system ATP-binding protein